MKSNSGGVLRWVQVVGILALTTLLLLIGVWRLARARSFQLYGDLIKRVETPDSVVVLTFDDGPTPTVLDSLVSVLDRHGARATFFVTGRELESFPEGGARLVAAGHELGNHTYSHIRMTLRSQDLIREEIERTDREIVRSGQQQPIYFRPPYSYKLIGLPYYLARHGRTTIMTDVEPDSYEEVAATKEAIVEHVLERVQPGSIILLHPWYPSRRTSLEAVPLLLDSLHSRGYEVTTVRDLLGRARPSP